MLEFSIFVSIFVAVAAAGVISTIGWIRADHQNEGLRIENCLLGTKLYSQETMLEKLRAENKFLRFQLEEKQDVQESKEDINS